MKIIKKYNDSFDIAARSLWLHKFRSVLTILGITVGIMAVIMVLSAGRAIENFIISQITMFGTDYLWIEVKVPSTAHTSSENASGMAQGVTITTMTLDDAEAVKKHPNVREVYGGQMGQEVINYQGQNKIAMIFGVTSTFDELDPGELADGRFFADGEDKGLSKVVVLGSNVKEDLFGDKNAIGEQIKINKQNYKIIGVMKKRGGSGVFSLDDIVFIPVRTLQKLILGVDYIQFIYAEMYDTSIADITADDVTRIMREEHDIDDPDKDDFAVTTTDQAMEILGTVTGAIKLLLLALASISLIVGGVGIMNVMYVSVAERTFEIGLRKAVGATYQSILRQFLSEAVIITVIGGIFGIIFGAIATFIVGKIASSYGFNWEFYISANYIILAVGVSVFVGFVSGLYPARAAAKMNPIDALRKE